jgi:DNA-binding CsgD family transcriptional regulator
MKIQGYILLLILLPINLTANSQPGISGKLSIDTTIWAPVAYLSLIPDLDNMYTMSNDIIIDKADIDASGSFRFNTQYLPGTDVILRFHVSKKGDMPASLIIGGKDENHFFLIANRNSDIMVEDTGKAEFMKDIVLKGYSPNQTLQYVDRVAGYLDTAGFNQPLIKTELIRSAIFENLRIIADTCSNQLASLYALSKSKFERNYPVNQQFYKEFLLRWKKQDNAYFTEFRKKIPSGHNTGSIGLVIVALVSIIAGFFACWGYFRINRKKQNLLQDLSVQERKIFSLLLEGRSNKEISETLQIGINTVKSHINSIYSKLQINSRKDLMNLNLDNN